MVEGGKRGYDIPYNNMMYSTLLYSTLLYSTLLYSTFTLLHYTRIIFYIIQATEVGVRICCCSVGRGLALPQHP